LPPLAGFLFGFDTVVISGADKKLQVLWNSSDAFHGTVVMEWHCGTVLGAIFGGIPTNKIGKRIPYYGLEFCFDFSIGSAFINPIVLLFLDLLG
jgi:hypothetical protein